MSRDPPGNKKRKLEFGMEECKEADFDQLFCFDQFSLTFQESTISPAQLLQEIDQDLRAFSIGAVEVGDSNPNGLDPTSSESATNDLEEVQEFLNGIDFEVHIGDAPETTAPANHQVPTSVEPPESRSDLGQNPVPDASSQQVQGTTTDNSLLEALRLLLEGLRLNESQEADDDQASLTSRERSSIDQILQPNVGEVRELDPTSNESARLPSPSNAAVDCNESENSEELVNLDSMQTTSPDQVTDSMASPESRSELEQLFLDIFSQHIQGTTTDTSLLEELRRLLPGVPLTHVNALIGQMLDWIEHRRGNESHNVQVLAPMEPDSNRLENCELRRLFEGQSNETYDPTMHSHGVSVGRGPYKCHFCGKLKKNCHCKLHDDGSGEVEGIMKRKFAYRPIENVEAKITASIERGLEFLKTAPLEDCSDSEESKKERSYVCNLCGYPKLPKEVHQSRCILGPNECFKMGKDGKTVFKVEEISSEKGTSERARNKGSDAGSEKDGDSTEDRCNPNEEEEDDRKPAAVELPKEDDDSENGDKDGGDRDDRPDKDSGSDTTGFDEIKRYAV